MAKKRKRKRQPTLVSSTVEDRRAEVITVAWMLAAMTTLGAEVVGGLLRIVLHLSNSMPASIRVFPNLLLFTAAITGLVCLSLTPFVYRFRRLPPPTVVTVLAVAVSVLPLAIVLAQSLR